MSEPKGAYYFMSDQNVHLPDVKNRSLSELLDQLEWCEYRCEGGPLRLNVAFIELRRRAEADRINERAIIIGSELFESALKYMDKAISFEEFKARIARAVGHEEGES